jgi:hypothetical protein
MAATPLTRQSSHNAAANFSSINVCELRRRVVAFTERAKIGAPCDDEPGDPARKEVVMHHAILIA